MFSYAISGSCFVFSSISSFPDSRLLTCCPLVPCFETNLSATRPRASRLSCSACSLRWSHSFLATPSLVRSIHNHLQGSLQDMHEQWKHIQFTSKETNAKSHAKRTHSLAKAQLQNAARIPKVRCYTASQVVHYKCPSTTSTSNPLWSSILIY